MSCGVFRMIQKAIGIASKVTHKVMGFKADYTLFTDPTDGTKVTLSGIYLLATPTDHRHEVIGSTQVMKTDDIYVVSREYLKSADVYYSPTSRDHFVKDGTTEPIFYVIDWTEDQEEPGTFTLLVRGEDYFHAEG